MRRSIASAATFVLLAGLAVLASPEHASASTSATFTYTGGSQDFVVPSGVTSLAVVADGAAGGPGFDPGGSGGEVRTPSLAVVPGETLRVFVGGIGGATGGFNGGGDPGLNAGPTFAGGGGATDVRRAPYTTSDRLIVAGGGGGGGGFSGPGGSGAGAGTSGSDGPVATGGQPGGNFGTGGAGAGGGGSGANGDVFGRGGKGGDATLGCCIAPNGGGGGGGEVGGGGGGGDNTNFDGGAGGGGGSSFGPDGSTFTTASGGPQVTITYADQPDAQIRVHGASAFQGAGAYSDAANAPIVKAAARKNRTRVFDIRIVNAGQGASTFVITGTAGAGTFTATYKDGTTDVTSQVTGAGYTTPSLAPGDSTTLTLAVRGKKGSETFLITATDGTLSDNVRAMVKIKR